MREDEIYRLTKAWFVANGFHLLAGQPPRGTDRLPVIEIKDDAHDGRGSLGAFKPDLVAANTRVIVVVECKPKRSEDDVRKLMGVKASQARRKSFAHEVVQRRLLERRGLNVWYPTAASIVAAMRFLVAYVGCASPDECEIFSLVFSPEGDAELCTGCDVVADVARFGA